MEILGCVRPDGGRTDIAFLFKMKSPLGGGRGCGFFEASSILLPIDADCAVGFDFVFAFGMADILCCGPEAAAAASDGETSNSEPFRICPSPTCASIGAASARNQQRSRSQEYSQTLTGIATMQSWDVRRKFWDSLFCTLCLCHYVRAMCACVLCLVRHYLLSGLSCFLVGRLVLQSWPFITVFFTGFWHGLHVTCHSESPLLTLTRFARSFDCDEASSDFAKGSAGKGSF